MDPISQHAEHLRLCLAMGLIEPSEVLQWADKTIRDTDDPPVEIIDLALIDEHSTYELLKQLGFAAQSACYEKAAHSSLDYLRTLFVRKEVSLNFACHAMQAYSDWANVSDAEKEKAWWISHAYSDAVLSFYGSIESAENQLMQFFAEVID